jgi:predicted metalloendopeptidase
MTLGEDMADISGMAICTEYLRDFHMYNNEILPIRNLSYKQFFIFYAHQMRQKLYKKSILSNLKTNPHPLDKYRTNISLSRLYLFRSIYAIKPSDKMYWHNIDTIW